ncbi:pseudouridylate synthase RPUSD2-like [Ostrea edulis]|uniref:pseudouridylate synthase RPUSD2-like n=1 Tax=Ostrea edulis TaxID=37623 RepID=UPI0024AE964B|nr:pseudouridylate synthase RPUSD2-like [Ostrea edulis]
MTILLHILGKSRIRITSGSVHTLRICKMADCFKPELEWSVDDPITSESSIDGATCPTVTLSSTSETGSQPPTNESSIDGKTNKIGTQPPSFSNPCPGTSKLGLENLSGKARRALIRKEKYKELKRKNKGLTSNPSPGYSIFNETDYYFENGLRKVYPYFYAFTTYVKGRWFNRTLCEIFGEEFTLSKEYDVKALVTEGLITVNGQTVSLDYKIKQGDIIENNIHRHENPVTGETIQVIEDNKDVIVVNKPSSIPCHPCGGYRYNSMVFILGKELGYGHLRTVYRLDRLTSGVLILAKNDASTRKYIDDITNRNVEKEYISRVEGEFPEGEVVCEQPIVKVSFKMGIMKCGADGKPSKTTFTRLSYNGKTSVVKCKPYTGRTHQIRVHLQYLGHPIVNDSCYNSVCFGPEKGKNGNYYLTDEQIRQLKEEEHNREMWTCAGENPNYLKRIKELKDLGVQSEHSSQDLEPTPKKKTKLISDKNGDTHSLDKSDCDLSDSGQTCSDQRLTMAGKPQPAFDWNRWFPSEACPICKKQFLDPKPSQLKLYLHALSYKGPDWYYETAMPYWAEPDWKEDT